MLYDDADGFFGFFNGVVVCFIVFVVGLLNENPNVLLLADALVEPEVPSDVKYKTRLANCFTSFLKRILYTIVFY